MSKLIEQYKKDRLSTIKSRDTEEWLDTVFTRPIGYLWARLFNHFDIHPNVVTVMSMILGAAAGVLFAFDADTTRGFLLNLGGVLLLMWANFYDSTDGQLARMTGKKTRLGRILDGAAGDIWFAFIYIAIAIRLYPHTIPLTDIQWKLWALLLVSVAGVIFHSRQSALADYYRNIHLYFLKGKEGSELDNYPQQYAIYKAARWKDDPVWKFFMWTYYRYTRGQEQQTPQFQQLMRTLRSKYPGGMPPQEFRDEFRRRSLPLMKWTNILTFNTRAIVLYISCLADIPWVYPLFEITVMTAIHWYMRHEHEKMSKQLNTEI